MLIETARAAAEMLKDYDARQEAVREVERCIKYVTERGYDPTSIHHGDRSYRFSIPKHTLLELLEAARRQRIGEREQIAVQIAGLR